MSGSAELAINKAFTAQIFDTRTDALAALAQPGAELFGIQHSHGGRVVVFGGGIPIRFAGEAIGAIGVSGGSVAEDVAIAEAGAVDLPGGREGGARPGSGKPNVDISAIVLRPTNRPS